MTELTVSLPFSQPPIGRRLSTHLQVQLTQEQAAALGGLHEALSAGRIRLANGRAILSRADVARWLLESIAAASECGRVR